jgi:hypothetical protein
MQVLPEVTWRQGEQLRIPCVHSLVDYSLCGGCTAQLPVPHGYRGALEAAPGRPETLSLAAAAFTVVVYAAKQVRDGPPSSHVLQLVPLVLNWTLSAAMCTLKTTKYQNSGDNHVCMHLATAVSHK